MKSFSRSIVRSFVVKARGGGGGTATGYVEEEDGGRCGTATWLARSWQPSELHRWWRTRRNDDDCSFDYVIQQLL